MRAQIGHYHDACSYFYAVMHRLASHKTELTLQLDREGTLRMVVNIVKGAKALHSSIIFPTGISLVLKHTHTHFSGVIF